MKVNKEYLINQIENKELIEEKSKTIRFLADKLEIEQLKNKELIEQNEILNSRLNILYLKVDEMYQEIK